MFKIYSVQDIHKFTIESLWFNFVTTFGFKFHCAYNLKPSTLNVVKKSKAKDTT